MLEAGVGSENFIIVPFPINHPELYGNYVPLDAVFFLTIYDEWGRRKRELFHEVGLKVEVLWERPIEQKGLSGADVRKKMASGQPWTHLVPKTTAALLEEWNVPQRLRDLKV
jgi:nicotinamide-nucleotide adenylyltransferase